MNQPQVDLLLLGRTGNGKSSTGNTILGRRAFRSKSSSDSVTVDVSYDVVEYNGRIIKVVDSPSVGDTRMDDEAGVKLVMDTMNNAIAMNVGGYHAFLLVMRFGGRFTSEDRTALELLKSIFGHDFLRKYCILTLTHGDDFEEEADEQGFTFAKWCSEQQGMLREIMLECNNRVLLFDNRNKDKRSSQLDHLLQMVDSLQMQGTRYCDEDFGMAKQARERAIVTAKEPHIREETMTETNLILQRLQQIGKLSVPTQHRESLEKLKTRVDDLYETVKSQDKGTGALHGLMQTVESIRRIVYG